MPKPVKKLSFNDSRLSITIKRCAVTGSFGGWSVKPNFTDALRAAKELSRIHARDSARAKRVVNHAAANVNRGGISKMTRDEAEAASGNVRLLHFLAKMPERKRPAALPELIELITRVTSHPKAKGLTISQIVSKGPKFFDE